MGANLGKSNNGVEERGEENLGDGLWTVKEVSNLINESANIVRNWLKDLGNHIPTQKAENGYNLFGKEGLERLREIQTLHRKQNFSIKQIDHYFSTGGEEYIPIKEEKVGEKLANELSSLREEIMELKKYNERQTGFNQKLLEELQKQTTYINESINKRDQQLLETINTLQKKKKEERKGFFRKFFK